MKIFGVSVWLILMLLAAYWLGKRYPNIFASVPLLNKM